MSEWTCRRCEGGFPKPIKAHGHWRCPWCGEQLAKAFTTKNHDPVERQYDF